MVTGLQQRPDPAGDPFVKEKLSFPQKNVPIESCGRLASCLMIEDPVQVNTCVRKKNIVRSESKAFKQKTIRTETYFERSCGHVRTCFFFLPRLQLTKSGSDLWGGDDCHASTENEAALCSILGTRRLGRARVEERPRVNPLGGKAQAPPGEAPATSRASCDAGRRESVYWGRGEGADANLRQTL